MSGFDREAFCFCIYFFETNFKHLRDSLPQGRIWNLVESPSKTQESLTYVDKKSLLY